MKRVTIEITLLLLLLILLKVIRYSINSIKLKAHLPKSFLGRSIHLTSSKFYHMLHLSLSPYLSITSHNFPFLFFSFFLVRFFFFLCF